MERIFALAFVAGALVLGSCADESEQITGQELGDKFKRGLTGHGQLGPIDRNGDPALEHGVPQTHP